MTTIPSNRAELRGRASGMIVLAWFGLAWTGWGLSKGLAPGVEVPVLAVAGLCFLGLVAAAINLFRRARTYPAGDPEAGRRIGRAIGWRFGLIVAVELIGLAVIARVLVVLGRPELVALIVCLGVGIHFFPLARLFHMPIYVPAGVALCVFAVLTAVLAPLLGAPVLWTALPGFGAALTLDITAALLPRGA